MLIINRNPDSLRFPPSNTHAFSLFHQKQYIPYGYSKLFDSNAASFLRIKKAHGGWEQGASLGFHNPVSRWHGGGDGSASMEGLALGLLRHKLISPYHYRSHGLSFYFCPASPKANRIPVLRGNGSVTSAFGCFSLPAAWAGSGRAGSAERPVNLTLSNRLHRLMAGCPKWQMELALGGFGSFLSYRTLSSYLIFRLLFLMECLWHFQRSYFLKELN